MFYDVVPSQPSADASKAKEDSTGKAEQKKKREAKPVGEQETDKTSEDKVADESSGEEEGGSNSAEKEEEEKLRKLSDPDDYLEIRDARRRATGIDMDKIGYATAFYQLSLFIQVLFYRKLVEEINQADRDSFLSIDHIKLIFYLILAGGRPISYFKVFRLTGDLFFHSGVRHRTGLAQ